MASIDSAATSGLVIPQRTGYVRHMPKARQRSAFPVAIVKSSVPRGDHSSRTVFDNAIAKASAIHAGGREFAKTTARQTSSAAAKPHRAGDRLAVDVADADDAEAVGAEDRSSDLGVAMSFAGRG